MGKQYNKTEKRRRRLAYLARQKEAAKSTRKPAARAKAPAKPAAAKKAESAKPEAAAAPAA